MCRVCQFARSNGNVSRDCADKRQENRSEAAVICRCFGPVAAASRLPSQCDRRHRQTRLWLLTGSASSLLEVRHSARLGDEQQVEDTLFRSHLAYLDAFLWKNSAKLDWASVQKGVAGTLAAFGNIRFQTQRRDTRSMTSSATMPMATPTNTSLVKWALRGI